MITSKSKLYKLFLIKFCREDTHERTNRHCLGYGDVAWRELC